HHPCSSVHSSSQLSRSPRPRSALAASPSISSGICSLHRAAGQGVPRSSADTHPRLQLFAATTLRPVNSDSCPQPTRAARRSRPSRIVE
ncbi:hypothetical protein C8J57DRAFT_1717474, partial [Mycena rebaudengoi]